MTRRERRTQVGCRGRERSMSTAINSQSSPPPTSRSSPIAHTLDHSAVTEVSPDTPPYLCFVSLAKHPHMDSNPEPAVATTEPTADAQVAPEQPTTEPVTQPLSKKAQKRAAKAAYLAQQKKERRAAEKERKKEKKRVLAEKRAAGELDEEDEARLRKKRRTGDGPRRTFKARVVVDLGFDDQMTENVSAWPEHMYRVCKSNCYTGGEVAHVAARLHLQREPESRTAV